MPRMQYSPFTSLQNLVRQRDARERCELCGVALSSAHRHLIEPVARKLVCACDACALLFDSPTRTKYKRVPLDVRLLNDFQMTDAQWESLLIPIGMAFFFKSSVQGSTLAVYPSPAGATESLLSLDSWQEIVISNPLLARMEPDVEALLVNRLDAARRPAEYYLVPIDKCYELVGLIRSRWRGLSGGAEVWEQIRLFFDALKMQASAGFAHA
ncbi:MAG TPA: DUF5947 family protein [Bryobacteraceae bacterium]|nr:DUF5947 family protein [Bryobacteraceae bacterium]